MVEFFSDEIVARFSELALVFCQDRNTGYNRVIREQVLWFALFSSWLLLSNYFIIYLFESVVYTENQNQQLTLDSDSKRSKD